MIDYLSHPPTILKIFLFPPLFCVGIWIGVRGTKKFADLNNDVLAVFSLLLGSGIAGTAVILLML